MSGEKRRRALWVVVAIGMVALVLSTTFAVLYIAQQSTDGAETAKAIRESQITNRRLAVDNAKVLDKVNDCTTPGRECFEDAQRRSAKVVNALNQGSAAAAAAAAACADRPGVEGYRAIKACVDQTLADQRD